VEKEKEEEVEDDHMTTIIVRYALISYKNMLHTEELHSIFCPSTQRRCRQLKLCSWGRQKI